MNNPSLKEKVIHSTPWIPYSYYWQVLSKSYHHVLPHWHTEFEINYIVSGRLEFHSDSQKAIASSGDIVIVQPNALHSIYQIASSPQANQYHTLVFNHSILSCQKEERAFVKVLEPVINGNVTLPSPITREHPYYEEIRTSMENIISCVKSSTPMLDLLLKSELLRLFYLILQCENIVISAPISKSHMNMAPVIDYVAEHYDEPIHLHQLAELVFLSPSHFMAQFKRSMGISAIAYVNQIRIQNVCRLLTHTDQNISSIAAACGFCNLSNFDQQFRKIIGCSPSEYRAMQ